MVSLVAGLTRVRWGRVLNQDKQLTGTQRQLSKNTVANAYCR